MKYIWEPQDLYVGLRVLNSANNEFIIGYIFENVHDDGCDKMYVLIDLRDGLIIKKMKRFKELSDHLNHYGYIPNN